MFPLPRDRALFFLIATTTIYGCSPPVSIARSAASVSSPSAAPVEVPLERARGYALIPVAIGGQDSLWFVLDSAAGSSVISPATRDLLGLKPDSGTTATVTGASGDSNFQAFELDSLSVGGLVRRNVGVVVVDLARFESQEPGRTFAGILGNDFLRHFDFVLDLPHGVLRLFPRGGGGQHSIARLDTLACVPNLADDPGWIVMDVAVEGTPVRAIVDTGAGRSVFNWVAGRQAGITPESPGVRKSDNSARGLGTQAAETYLYSFERVEAGPTRFRRTESRIADISVFQALGLDKRPAVIFGTNYLEDRALVVSYTTDQICFSDPIAAAAP